MDLPVAPRWHLVRSWLPVNPAWVCLLSSIYSATAGTQDLSPGKSVFSCAVSHSSFPPHSNSSPITPYLSVKRVSWNFFSSAMGRLTAYWCLNTILLAGFGLLWTPTGNFKSSLGFPRGSPLRHPSVFSPSHVQRMGQGGSTRTSDIRLMGSDSNHWESGLDAP